MEWRRVEGQGRPRSVRGSGPHIGRTMTGLFAAIVSLMVIENATGLPVSEAIRETHVMQTRIIGDMDHGAHVRLHVGDGLTLRLEVIPGTGYAWQVAQYDRAVLSQIGEPAFEHRDAAALGAITHQVLRFATSAPGTTRLELEYRRAWDRPGMGTKTFFVDVTAEP